MTDSNLVEKFNQIKYKLNKYLNVKDNLKIKAYLTELDAAENVTISVLQESQIVECLRTLKHKQDPEFSSIAGKIMLKWKSAMKVAEKETKLKSSSSDAKLKEEKKEFSLSSSSNQTNSKPSSKSSDLSKTANESNKKRLPIDKDTDLQSKKPKLSLTDYKVKEEQDEDENESNRYSPSPMSINRNVNNKQGNSLKLPVVAMPSVPLPTMPLKDIFSSNSISSGSNNNTTKNYQTFANNLLSKTERPISLLADDEALTKIMSCKQSKRVLYTGRKNTGDGSTQTASKLFDLASRALMESLDDLPTRISAYNARNQFPVAFDLLKMVLERANPKQLQTIEYYSPHLLEDTDYLWKKLCEQEFKKVDPPEEDESWRELYFRKFDEREEKFRRARDLISRKQAEKPKERQTQIATVKFASASRSSSIALSSSSVLGRVKSSSSAVPVRPIMHDSSAHKRPSSAGSFGGKKPIPTGPPMSQGMKATMRLMKKAKR